MFDGTIEQSDSLGGSHLSVLEIQAIYLRPGPVRGAPHSNVPLDTSERFLYELFWPEHVADTRVRNAYFAEANNRLAAPLYCLAFAFIAFAAVTRGRGGRGAYALRLTMASGFAGVIRIIGYGAQGAASRNPTLCLLLYFIPLAGAGLALLDIAGFDPGTLFSQFRQAPMAEPAR